MSPHARFSREVQAESASLVVLEGAHMHMQGSEPADRLELLGLLRTGRPDRHCRIARASQQSNDPPFAQLLVVLCERLNRRIPDAPSPGKRCSRLASGPQFEA
jgi:hypothetical protein